jgi:RNA polymerase sigma factor (TIGR02999 family)
MTYRVDMPGADERGSDASQLPPEAMDELRKVAAALLRRERPGHTLQPTALVHEAYLRLGARLGDAWRNAHGEAAFRSYAAHAMRQILVSHARKHTSEKRGRGWMRVEMVDAAVEAPDALELLALHDALEALAALDPRKARVVELRFFGGLTLEEAAEVLNVARSTADADWSFARAWLARRLACQPPAEGPPAEGPPEGPPEEQPNKQQPTGEQRVQR